MGARADPRARRARGDQEPGEVPTVSSVDPGTLLEGRFKLLDRVGEGGMAEVWRAIDTRGAAEVAVKIMRLRLARDPVLRTRFRNEADNTRRVRSRHVVEILELVSEAEPPFFVMPLLRGHPLDEHLRHTGGLPYAEAHAILAAVLDGLAAAHRCGVVHRDVKPHNIFLERPREGETSRAIKLLDFGVAWDDRRTVTLTSQGAPVGTPAYMAPEVRIGEPGCQRPAADVYAAGVVAHEMVVGVRPRIELGERPPRLDATEAGRAARVPPAFAAAVDRALSVAHQDRFPTAAEFLAAVEAAAPAAPSASAE
jgi:serine/threonine-protein kinase